MITLDCRADAANLQSLQGSQAVAPRCVLPLC